MRKYLHIIFNISFTESMEKTGSRTSGLVLFSPNKNNYLWYYATRLLQNG